MEEGLRLLEDKWAECWLWVGWESQLTCCYFSRSFMWITGTWILCLATWRQKGRRLWVAGLFHPLLCSFCCFTALFPKGTILLQLLFACLFQGVTPSRHKERFLSNFGKALFVTLVSKFFSSGQKLSCSHEITSESWPTMLRARSAMQEKKNLATERTIEWEVTKSVLLFCLCFCFVLVSCWCALFAIIACTLNMQENLWPTRLRARSAMAQKKLLPVHRQWPDSEIIFSSWIRFFLVWPLKLNVFVSFTNWDCPLREDWRANGPGTRTLAAKALVCPYFADLWSI